MGRFSGIREAKFFEGGVYFEAIPIPLNAGETEKDRKWATAKYLVRINALKIVDTRKKKTAFVAETTILESEHPARRAGTSCSYYADDGNDAFLGNVKHVVSVVTDTAPEDVDEAGVEMAVSEENPCQGTIVQVFATMQKTRAGGDFTKCVFQPATPEQLAKYTPKTEQKSA